MASTTISSLALWDAARVSMSRTQNQVGIASQEVTTGRHYDVGIALGTDTSRAIDGRVIMADMNAITAMNGVVGERLSAMQASLTGMLGLARSLFAEAAQAGHAGVDRELFVQSARSKLETLQSLLSVTSNGSYAFSGTNSLTAPVADYLGDPPSAARSAVIGAFTAEFGIAPDDPAVANLTGDQLKNFWGGSYASLFETPAWQSAFSNATGDAITFRIGPAEYASYSTSANDAGVRNLYSALVAVIDAGTSEMSAEAFGALAGLVAGAAGSAAADIARSQGALGETQGRMTDANKRMETRLLALEKVVGGLEGVDQVEASTRLNSLTTQLQISYAVTARMFKLSLLDYI